jgi:homoserine dehydrogenase
MRMIPIALIGFGNVGQAFARLLKQKQDELKSRYQIKPQVVAIATGHHGMALSPDGLDLPLALELADSKQSLASLSPQPAPGSVLELIHACQAQVLFENSPVNYTSGQPALQHIQTALEAGMHVVSANKGPLVHGYRQLMDLAQSMGCRYLFESTVMDGAPVFGMWREALPGAKLQSVRGVLNSTTNLIFNRMEQGQSFDQAVRHAQEIGIAETDPSGDIDGWDAAIKLAAIATVLMGQPLLPSQVDRTGISHLTAADIQASQQQGLRWKLVCSASLSSGGLKATVRPEAVGPEDPLYFVSGTSSAITFHSDVLGPLTLTEQDPGPQTTAYGLLADFLNAVAPGQPD